MRIGPKDVALVIVSTIASLLVAEGIAHLFIEPTPRVTGFRLLTSGYYVEDGELGWVPRPRIRGLHSQEGSFQSVFSTNSLGLRDEEPMRRSRGRQTRIVALGDSFTWGFGVNDEEIYTSVIEELLPTVEVVNLGVTAYGLRQEAAYFERIGRSMKPDLVLLALVMNDITDPARRLSNETVHEWRARIGFGPSSGGEQGSHGTGAESGRHFRGLKPWLMGHSILYRSIIDIVNAHKAMVDLLVWIGIKGQPAGLEGLDTNLQPFLKSYPESVRASVEQTKQELLDLRDKAQQSGSRLLIVVVPALQSVDRRARRNSISYTQYYEDDFDMEKPYRWLRELGKSAGIEILNPIETFREAHEAGDALYLRNDMHFSAAGHRLFAGEIARFLVDQHWTR